MKNASRNDSDSDHAIATGKKKFPGNFPFSIHSYPSFSSLLFRLRIIGNADTFPINAYLNFNLKGSLVRSNPKIE